jgi:hypothetical protein
VNDFDLHSVVLVRSSDFIAYCPIAAGTVSRQPGSGTVFIEYYACDGEELRHEAVLAGKTQKKMAIPPYPDCRCSASHTSESLRAQLARAQLDSVVRDIRNCCLVMSL